MARGLATFVGARLRGARIARQMTAVALAEAVGVAAASISRYEHGDAEPRADTLDRLADVLRVQRAYFGRPVPPGQLQRLDYRSKSAATKQARESGTVKFGWLLEIADYISDVIPLPDAEIPDLGFKDPAAIALDDIEDAAERVRGDWGMKHGPISDLIALLETKGIVVSCIALNADKLDAFSGWLDARPAIMINSENGTAVRFRFDAAHELGHLVLHRQVDDRIAARSEVHKLMEKQAHRFASAFLFPAKPFMEEVFSVSLPNLLPLKRRWRLSIQMMIRRAFDLELISQDQYEHAFRGLAVRGLRRHEPLDAELVPERPKAIRERLDEMMRLHHFSRGDVVDHMRLDPRELEALCALPTGMLSGPEGEGATSSLQSGAEGRVVPFFRK